jgi:hypothetical protein
MPVAWHDSDADTGTRRESPTPSGVGQSWRHTGAMGTSWSPACPGQPCLVQGFPAVLASHAACVTASTPPAESTPAAASRPDHYAVGPRPIPPNTEGTAARRGRACPGLRGPVPRTHRSGWRITRTRPGTTSRQTRRAVPLSRILDDDRFRAIVERHTGHIAPRWNRPSSSKLAERVRPPSSPAGSAAGRTPHKPRSGPTRNWPSSSSGVRAVHGPRSSWSTAQADKARPARPRQLAHTVAIRTAGPRSCSAKHATSDQIAGLGPVRASTLVVVWTTPRGRSRATRCRPRCTRPIRCHYPAATARPYHAGAWRTDRVGTSPLLDDLADDPYRLYP